jgi:hypothetical protein
VRFHDVEPLASRLSEARARLSKGRARLSEGEALLSLRGASRCTRFHVVEPLASRLSKSREPLSKLPARRCKRFDVVEPSASRRSAFGERLFEERAPRSEGGARLCERFHDVEPLASRRTPERGRRSSVPARRSLERARRPVYREAPPLVRESPRPKRHGLAEVGEPRLRRHAHPHGNQEARHDPHERRILSVSSRARRSGYRSEARRRVGGRRGCRGARRVQASECVAWAWPRPQAHGECGRECDVLYAIHRHAPSP